MANHALPTTTDTYANVLTYLHARIDDASKWYDSSLTYTNAPVGTVQWDSTALTWKKNTGTVGAPVWTALAASYNININGTVGATTAAAGTFTTLTVNTSVALPATATMGGSTIANLGSGAQTFTGSMSFTNASPIVSAKIGPVTGQQHTIPAVTSDTIALIAASQTFTNKTYSSGALSGTFSGNHTISGQATFNEATAPIISAKLGPSAAQQHTLPAVASDTIALLAATQTFTNKTLTSPTISGGSIANAPISGSTGSFTTLASTSGYVQSPGLSSSYGVTSGTSTGAFNAVMGTAASATWLLSGTSGGTFRYGIQGLDAGGTLRFYTGTSWLAFDTINLTNSSGHTFVTSANYNSYAPTLTGTGASGTWGISISGTATNQSGGSINATTGAFSSSISSSMSDNGVLLQSYNTSAGSAAQFSISHAFGAVNIANSRGAINIQGNLALHSGNYNSYAPTLTGTGASGTWGINITGLAYPRRSDGSAINFYWSGQAGQPTWLWGGGDGTNMYVYNPSNFAVSTAVNLSTTGANWSTNGTISAVVGQLAWKNYGNNHVIFDASASTAPNGSAVNNTNPAVNWSGAYPTLMGWNGSQTYGVRVDSARTADTLGGNGYSATSGANSIVQRDSNGYIQNNYFYTSGGGSERNASGISYFAGFNSGDYYIRSYTAAAVAAALSGQTMNINGSSTSCSGNAATATSATNATNATNLTGSGTISSTTTAVTQVAGTNNTTIATTAFVAASSSGLGIGQTWQNMTASRALGTTYTNTTGKPIEVSIYYGMSNGGGYVYATTNGITVIFGGGVNNGGGTYPGGDTIIIAAGATYLINFGVVAGSMSLSGWYELR